MTPSPHPTVRPAARSLRRLAALALIALTGCTGCGEAAPDDVQTPLAKGREKDPAAVGPAPVAPARPLPTFVDVAAEAGVDVMNHSGKPRQKDWIVSGMGGGTIITDYDNDGDMDICVVDGTMITEEGELEFHDDWRTRLFRNDGNLKFTDVTEAAGIDVKAFGFGGASCDYDGDGDDDLYICTWGRNYLLRNRGDGTFEDVTAAAGLLGDEKDMSTSCAWADLNGDGIQDLYVANYIDQWAQIRTHRDAEPEPIPARNCNWRGHAVYCGPPGLVGQPDRLYFGKPDGTFEDVSSRLVMSDGSPQPGRYGFQPIIHDADGDGDLDIYVANDTQTNYHWMNDGKGNFVDRAVEVGTGMNRDVEDQAGMGVDAADVNRDGKIDLLVTNFSHDYNTLYISYGSPGRPMFRDQSHGLQIANLAYTRLSWGTRMLDYDCDGELDMFVACGHVYGEVANYPETGTSYEQKNLLLRNLGPGARYGFEDATNRAGTGLQIERVWRGAAFADFDDDGDMDIFVTALNGKAALLRNDGGNANGWLRFRLTGKGSLRDPSGAIVRLHMPDGRVHLEELHNGASFCCDNDPRLFFGTGAVTTVPKVTVTWPNGETHTFENVAASKAYRIDQESGKLEDDVR